MSRHQDYSMRRLESERSLPAKWLVSLRRNRQRPLCLWIACAACLTNLWPKGQTSNASSHSLSE
ncbi:hypothetical protein PILCRDRAFT_825115 [Piloderma croceum F 1598]|uniref:Uncharacterized protein n=1 Tax=Piloderma croceum (strain F 1598) TaxID=765440 RepID=A0A0C3BK18_PILCF|nr:hypothetical protein PILCRDRAFT_825115 [Piloderma croceum F 1598]